MCGTVCGTAGGTAGPVVLYRIKLNLCLLDTLGPWKLQVSFIQRVKVQSQWMTCPYSGYPLKSCTLAAQCIHIQCKVVILYA